MLQPGEQRRARRCTLTLTAPTATLTAPNPGATVSGTVTLSATAADSGGSGLARVDFLLDGTVVGSATSAPPRPTATLDPASASMKYYIIAARAVDGAGTRLRRRRSPSRPATRTCCKTPASSPGRATPRPAGRSPATAPTPSPVPGRPHHAHSRLARRKPQHHLLHQRRPQDAQRLQRHLLDCHRRRPQVHDHRLVQVDDAARHLRLHLHDRPDRRLQLPGPVAAVSHTTRFRPWTTPAMPAGTTNLSIGMGLNGLAGDVWMDDFAVFQTG